MSSKDQRLIDEGWKVIHFWEHEIAENLEKCVRQIMQEIENAS